MAYDPYFAEEIILEVDANIAGIDVTIRYEQGVDPDDYSDVLDPKTGKTSAEFIALWDRSSEEDIEYIKEEIRSAIRGNDYRIEEEAFDAF